jgi:hypothetical protein
MPAPFDDIKPFPGQHHNDPPLEARVTIDFDDALRARGLDARVAEIVESADRSPDPIESADDAGKAADLVAMARDAKQAIDAERELLNRPLLTAQRSLKARADSIVAPMEAAVSTIRDRLDDWVAANEAPALGDYGAKASARETWEFVVADYSKLPVAIRRHPDVLTAIDRVVRSQVRGGARKISGVRIFPTVKAAVR